MTREERRELIGQFCAWKTREITPQWFLCASPNSRTLMHVCRPGTWTRLQVEYRENRFFHPDLLEGIVFSPWRDFKCKSCGEELETYMRTVIKLLALKDALCV